MDQVFWSVRMWINSDITKCCSLDTTHR